MNTATYRTIIEPDGKGYHGYVPSLPGCHTHGRTIEETQANLKEAIEGYILARSNRGWMIPQDTLIETLQTVSIPPDARIYA